MPHCAILMRASWAINLSVFGLGPEINIVPQSAKPIMRTLDLSNILRRPSKARFQAIGLGVPFVKNQTIVESNRVDWQDLVFM